MEDMTTTLYMSSAVVTLGDVMSLVDFGERLVEERIRLGYTQASFARLLGVSRVGLRNIEAGESDFKAHFMASAAAAGVDVQYILTGHRSPNAEEVAAEISMGRQSINGNVTGVGFAQSGAQVQIINTSRHVTRTKAETKPGLEHITEEQKVALKGLVDRIVETEAKLKSKPKTHRAVWAALNKHCGVTTYSLIKHSDFAKARKYLDMWIGRLNAAPSAAIKDGDVWRKRQYAYIKINSKDPTDAEALNVYMKRNFKAESLTELSNDELEKVYRYIAGRRNKRK